MFRRRRLAFLGGGWTPARLFGASQSGAWYDPSDLTTLWQDSGRTTPVTADGDPVGAWDDKSGNGNTLTQTSASLRPVYHTSAGLHWVEADGVDDYMVLSKAFLDVTADASAGFALSVGAFGDNPYLIGTNGADQGFEFLLFSTTGKPRAGVATTGSNIFATATIALVVDAKHSFIQEWDRSAGSVVCDQDGAQIVNTSGTPADINTPTLAYNIFTSETLAARTLAVNLYGMAIVSAPLSVDDKINLKTWLDGKAGL